MDWKSLFFSADGRIGRGEFWIGWLVLLGVGVVTGWIPLVGTLVWLVAIYCTVCIYAKRLHDMGKSGWLQVIPIAIGILAGGWAIMSIGFSAVLPALSGASEDAIAASAIGGLGAGLLGFGVAFLVWFGFLLWIGLTPGEPAANRFGAPPARGPMANQTSS